MHPLKYVATSNASSYSLRSIKTVNVSESKPRAYLPNSLGAADNKFAFLITESFPT